jgi:hypothetical protein
VVATLLMVIFAIRTEVTPAHRTLEEELQEELETAGSISATASG